MENQLRDIKPLLEIPDNSYNLYFGLVAFGIFILLTIVFFVGLKFILKRQESLKRQYLRELKDVEWSNPKRASYRVTKLGRALVHDERTEEIFKQTVAMLEQYKYKKEVPKVDEATLRQYNLLVHVLDESI